MSARLIILFIAALASLGSAVTYQKRTFTVDYSNNTFLRDGKPFRYMSGSIDYQRVPYQYWEDRMKKMRAGGFNAVQTYVPWNLHEPQPQMYDFYGQQNIVLFLELAMKYDLVVILRPGPFICDEWDYGGLPAWLLKGQPDVFIRTMDPRYLKPVDRWFSVLFSVIKPYLYINGGPIITLQIENEYGYFPVACDFDYVKFLTQKAKTMLGDDLVLFTVDGAIDSALKCGNPFDGSLLATLDFGLTFDPKAKFDILRKYQPKGPLVNSEFYTGRFDSWGLPHVVQDPADTAKSIDLILSQGASIDLDMLEGGTTFGFMNGANYPNMPEETSYDYDSPLSEAGDVREKFMLIREVFKKYRDFPDYPIPPNLPKFAYGKVTLYFIGTVHDYIVEHTPINSKYPVTFEDLEHYYGFVMYRHVLKDNVEGQKLDLSGVRDRAYVCVDQTPIAVVERNTNYTTITVSGKKGQMLDLLVENQGRLSFGVQLLNSTKGIVTNVTLDGDTVTDWIMYPVILPNKYPSAMTHIPKNYRDSTPKRANGLMTPAFYRGQFDIPFKDGHPMDTYLDMVGWFKGQAFINGFNVGRYWPVRGPQIRLYVPKFVLQQGINVVEFLELENAPCSGSAPCKIEFFDQPKLNGTVHPDPPTWRGPGTSEYKTRRQFVDNL